MDIAIVVEHMSLPIVRQKCAIISAGLQCPYPKDLNVIRPF